MVEFDKKRSKNKELLELSLEFFIENRGSVQL